MLPYICIERFGIRMHQMRDQDSEIVMQGRNQPFVRQNHFFDETITPEQHRRWYEKVSLSHDYYLVVSRDGINVGLLYMKDINEQMRNGNIGLFFWDVKILHTRVPLLAIITFLDFFLHSVGMQTIQARIRLDNKVMLHFVEFFELDLKRVETENLLLATLPASTWIRNRTALMKFAQRLSPKPESWLLKIEGEPSEHRWQEVRKLIYSSKEAG